MNKDLLLKGFEVELFTGFVNGEHFGVSSDLTKELSDYVKEPDMRNIEYITVPHRDYSLIKDAVLSPRKKLRSWLKERNLTLIPGSTLSLGDSKQFFRSDPDNTYHNFIEKTYGSKVVTTSIHINLGIDDLPKLFAAIRLVRCEASLFLALSASSPFIDGSPSGNHSQRWIQFPITPKEVPFFKDHDHYLNWVERQLDSGLIYNERHLWCSVRPNGPSRPYHLNRLELRICDLITDCDLLIAVTTLLELRVLNLFRDFSNLDPLNASELNSDELIDLCDSNDVQAAKKSLDANLFHWRNSEKIKAREWISQLLDEVMPLAIDLDMVSLLSPIQSVLKHGNQAMKWLNDYDSGNSVQDVMKKGISEMINQENLQNSDAMLEDL